MTMAERRAAFEKGPSKSTKTAKSKRRKSTKKKVVKVEEAPV